MQRRKLNVPLFIGLIVGSIVFVLGGWFLHDTLMERNASKLKKVAEGQLEEATKERRKGNSFRKAVTTLEAYTKLQPKDRETALRLASYKADLYDVPMKVQDEKRKELGGILRFMEGVLRTYDDGAEDTVEVRKRLVDIYLDRHRDGKNSLEHVDLLLENDPDNGEWLARKYRAQLLNKDPDHDLAYQIIGYDKAEKKFDDESAKGADQVRVYAALANHLRLEEKNSELADLIMARLVEVNPTSAEARIARGNYFYRFRGTFGDRKEADIKNAIERATEDAKKAVELEPKDEGTILFAVRMARINGEWDEVRKIATRAVEQYPDNVSLCHEMVFLEQNEPNGRDAKQRYAAALAHVEQGIKVATEASRPEFMYMKVNLQLDMNEVEDAKKTIKEMKEIEVFAEVRPELLDLLEARILYAESDWVRASRRMKQLRPVFAGRSDGGSKRNVHKIDSLLGVCYARLGRSELAKQTFVRSFNEGSRDPIVVNAVARMGLIKPRNQESGSTAQSSGAGAGLQDMIRQLKTVPIEDRDWTDVNNFLDKVAEQQKMSPVRKAIGKAKIFIMTEDYGKAIQEIKTAYSGAQSEFVKAKKTDKNAKLSPEVEGLLYQLISLRLAKKEYPQAGAILDKIEADYGDSARTRLLRAEVILRSSDGDPRDKLRALEKNLDDIKEANRGPFWKNLSKRYAQAGLQKDRIRCLREAAKLSPKGLVERTELFHVALQLGDMKQANRTLGEIEKLVGKEDSDWQVCEAWRILQMVRMRRLDRSELEKARGLANRAKKQRPEWQNVYFLLGEINLQDGKLNNAIVSYELSRKYGGTPLRQLYDLYVRTRRYRQAKEIEDMLGENSSNILPVKKQVATMMAHGNVSEALAKAEEYVAAGAENPSNQLWLGSLYAAAKKPGKAELAFRAAQRLRPENIQAWVPLIQLLASQKKMEEAELQMRKAQMSISDEQIPVFLAKCSELLGRRVEAEKYYLMSLQNSPDSTGMLRAVATYYLSPTYYRADGTAKASIYLKRILELQDSVPETDPSLIWSRQTSAKLLASQKTYENVIKALELLDANQINGQASLQDDVLKALILSKQRDVKSRAKAIELYEKVDASGKLAKDQQIILSRLYNDRGEWDKGRPRLYRLLEAYPNDSNLLVTLCTIHMGHKELDHAERMLEKIEEIAPDSLVTLQLKAQLLSEQGKSAEAVKVIEKLLPSGTAEEKDLRTLRMVAVLFERLDQFNKAESIFRRCIRLDRNDTLQFASYLGRRNRVDEAFAELEKMVPDAKIAAVAQTGVGILRANPSEDHKEYQERIQGWLDKGLREDPGSKSLLFLLASFKEVQKDYDAVEATYEKLLKNNDVEGGFRAICLNNMAFMLATRNKDFPRALGYVNDAIAQLGPNPDLLDTRAIVYLKMGDPGKAIDELQVSIAGKPEAATYFHKAMAHFAEGDRKAARRAWNKALELGLKGDDIRDLERESYEQLRKEFGEEVRKSAA